MAATVIEFTSSCTVSHWKCTIGHAKLFAIFLEPTHLFDRRRFTMGFLVDNVARREILLQAYLFPVSLSFQHCSVLFIPLRRNRQLDSTGYSLGQVSYSIQRIRINNTANVCSATQYRDFIKAFSTFKYHRGSRYTCRCNSFKLIRTSRHSFLRFSRNSHARHYFFLYTLK